jgi:hypothetical protein
LSSLLKISVSSLFIFLTLSSHGGDPYRPSAGAGEAGMGYVCVMKGGFWKSFHNQASLAYNKSYSAGFSYESKFGISELATRTAGITIPAGKASLGAVYSNSGYHDFRREMTGLACGMKLSEKLSAGVQVDYFAEKTFGEYGNHQAFTCEAGLLAEVSDKINIGVHIFNPVPGSLRGDFMPAILRAGIGTELNSSLFAGAEAEMSSERKMIFRSGFEFEAAKKLWLRGGFSTDNNSFCFGFGYLARFVLLDLGFTTHEKLGVTSSASLIFKLRNS